MADIDSFFGDPFFYDTETAEHKHTIPSKLDLARDIAAFANTQGGYIIIGKAPKNGVEDRTFVNLTVADVVKVTKSAKKALLLLHPEPNIKIEKILGIEDGSGIWVSVKVEKHPQPVFLASRYYVRKGNKTSLAEEDLIDALSEAVPSLEPNILTSLESVEPNEKRSGNIGVFGQSHVYGPFPNMAYQIGDVAGNNINRFIHQAIEEKPHFDLTNLLAESIKHTREDLTRQRNVQLQQARITFIVAISVLILAILLVFVGIILIFTNKIQAGTISSVASIISGMVSGLALALNKQTSDRMDGYAKELVILEKSYTAMQYLSHIADIKIRDEAIRDLAKSISSENQASK